MSGHGAPTIGFDSDEKITAAGLKLAIIAASWHTEIMDGLLAGALRGAADAGIETPWWSGSPAA